VATVRDGLETTQRGRQREARAASEGALVCVHEHGM
jgi:hypothetical protein